eukprot:5785193-Pyramimonas_sp.AAC.1
MPLYELVYSEGRLSKVAYVNGDVGIVPPHVTIPPNIPLSNATSIDDACLVVNGNPLHVSTNFTQGTGPHKYRLDKKGLRLQALCKQA